MVAALKSEWVAAFKSEYPAGFIGIRNHPPKLQPVGLGSAHMHVAEYLLASGLSQLPRLRVNALALAAR
jgi:hypothetical protein